MPLSLTIKGEQQLRPVARALRRAGDSGLRDELRKAFKAAGQTTLRRVKNNVETMSIRGRRKATGRHFREVRAGNNIRRRISRVTRLQIVTSGSEPKVRFVVDSGQLADIKAQRLPWHLDTGKVFRHPVMGNRSVWVGQSGRPWFYDEIKKDRDVFVDECDKAIERTIRQIEGA